MWGSKTKIFLLLFNFLCVVNFAFSQQSSITISDTTDPSLGSEKIALYLNSYERGLLIPRMSFDNMQKIQQPKDGLLVYVLGEQNANNITTNEQGIWFYDGDYEVWTRLKEWSDNNDLAEPIGTIVPFTGDISKFYSEDAVYEDGLGRLETEMQGWALCNGNNGTPDLSSRFIVGAKINSYDFVGASSQESLDSFYVKKENIPEHKHDPENVKIMEIDHHHDIDLNNQHSHELTKAWGRTNGAEVHPRATSGNGFQTFPTELIEDLKPQLEIQQASFEVDVQLPQNSILPYGKPEGKVQALDNRPPFYTVAFIIKVGMYPYGEPYTDEAKLLDVYSESISTENKEKFRFK